jgi:retinol dehydrogenase 12
MKREQRLDVLTNNAGVMIPPAGSKTSQGHELQMGTNCLGPYLLTKLLTPLLEKTAASSPPGSVRVTWAASLGTYFSPKTGVVMESTGPKIHSGPQDNYTQTKAGNAMLAQQYQAAHPSDGIISNSWNPGNLKTELQRHTPAIGQWVLNTFMLFPSIYGAYTELYAGWAEESGKPEMKGAYYGPWGRVVRLRADVKNSPNEKKFWEWCEQESKDFA